MNARDHTCTRTAHTATASTAGARPRSICAKSAGWSIPAPSIATPCSDRSGSTAPKIIAAGDPASSVLLYRMAKTGSGRMPHIASDVVDARGVALIGQWIAEMNPGQRAGPSRCGRSGDRSFFKRFRSARSSLCIRQRRLLARFTPPNQQSSRRTYVKECWIGAMASSLPATHDLFDQFTGRDMASAPKLGANIDRAKLLAMPGDAKRGREVFLNVAQCATCHHAGDIAVRDFGPNLSKIAGKYDKITTAGKISWSLPKRSPTASPVTR